MKTLLLDKEGNIGKIVGEFTQDSQLIYNVAPCTWSGFLQRYMPIGDVHMIHEDFVECIDTNDSVIRNAKSAMMGFDSFDNVYFG